MKLTRFYSILLCLGIVHTIFTSTVDAKHKFDGDFEFDEEDNSKANKKLDKKKWIHDPENDLCQPLKCKKSEICLLEDAATALCVSKKEFHKSRITSKLHLDQPFLQKNDGSVKKFTDDAYFDSEDEDNDEDQDELKCQECPVQKPNFICGTDNRTYSSMCRLKYHNCIHHMSVRLNCTGFCPCKKSFSHSQSKKGSKELKMVTKKNLDYDSKLTPQDFNFENHHYRYLQYLRQSKIQKEHKIRNKFSTSTNSVGKWKKVHDDIDINSVNCRPSSNSIMANRLLDWFSVVMAETLQRRQHYKAKSGHFPSSCQTEVKWMFGHLDTNGDERISQMELFGLEHDQNEPCLKPFLDTCDLNEDGIVTGSEWCSCFSKAERPCAAVRRRTSPEIAPNCDSQGYFRSIQCHKILQVCWCVDKHGIEYAGTRVRRSKPNCDSIIEKRNFNALRTNRVDLQDDEDDSQIFEGSADYSADF
ncbi:hypothetical protein TKK_0004325 [Trichogramma kaykai]|uniref:Kazal-like domain-containing protein n=1 Tax=Trichogramma kaykai TaxID=54128 RepID=A0ABD2XKP8_9HYME